MPLEGYYVPLVVANLAKTMYSARPFRMASHVHLFCSCTLCKQRSYDGGFDFPTALYCELRKWADIWANLRYM